jgi:hypothetical protein
MRYIFGFLIGIGLIVLLFVLIFHHGGPAPAPNGINRLVDFANSTATVSYTDDYPVKADQTHNIVTTVVGRDQASTTVEQGYQGTVIRSQSFANNPTAYAAFLRALQVSGFANGKDDPALSDYRGYCPMGHRYIFEVKDGSRTLMQRWATSCGNTGTFSGRTSTVIQLFRLQVPTYNQLTSGLGSV